MTRLDWDRARERQATRPREPKFRPGPTWRWQPPTERQLRVLDRLHVGLYGSHYEPPRGLTRAAASDLIDCWIDRLGS
jgi:hypothetical protein